MYTVELYRGSGSIYRIDEHNEERIKDWLWERVKELGRDQGVNLIVKLIAWSE